MSEKEPENISSGIKRFFDNADYFVKRSKSLLLGIAAGIGAIILAFTQLGGSDDSYDEGYYEEPYYEDEYYDDSYDEGYYEDEEYYEEDTAYYYEDYQMQSKY